MSAFDEVISIINAEGFQNYEHWESFKLSAIKTRPCPLSETVNGIYLLTHPKYQVIYIGKGKPISKRIRCHYNATLGKETAPAWKQFFEFINSEITVYWHPLDEPEDYQVGEWMREAVEKILLVRYCPLFDRIYPKGRHRTHSQFDSILAKISNVTKGNST